MRLCTDYESLPKYLPDQLKSVKILEKTDSEITTMETIQFQHYLKKSFEQKCIHKKISNNKLLTEIISGPAKGSIIQILFEKIDSGSQISVNIDLKLSLKAKFLQPIIKLWYKRIILGILYKMNAIIMNENN